jgi:hypothetical protein
VTFLGKSLSVVIIVLEVEGTMLGDVFKKRVRTYSWHVPIVNFCFPTLTLKLPWGGGGCIDGNQSIAGAK